MNAKVMYRMCVLVLGAALCLQTTAVTAGIVTVEQLAASNKTEMERTKVQEYFDRDDVKHRLQALGVDEPSAKARVAAMTSQEVHAMAQQIDSLPVGGSFSNNDLLIIVVVLLLIIII